MASPPTARRRARRSTSSRSTGSSAPRPAAGPALPKGLSTASLSRVAKCLAECDTDVSAAELAATLGMSRVSARRYLEHLVSTGAAEVAPRYGSAGRPEHRYRMPAGAPG